ncbi:group III truncated hemoglobin [Moheibacter lacus]|uniref:Group III truncated hemoglobin n=1 Tax=Moheibacter lacus TaxID=2745851 RepID=A0A838ZGI1_9FLAO|nr:group III truncated hemoglobin [Moheibacter lacus]MBA5628378.1 group III truncated hemoglobin [Moheibacter lacus]
MEERKDIEKLDDVKVLVDTFYGKVRQDELIGGIFNDIIQDRWPEHLEKMYKFWQTVLLEEHTYSGRPFVPHLKMPIEKEHFDRWLELFFATVDELYLGQKADLAKWQGNRMAEMFLLKIEYFRKNSQQTPLL